MKEIHVDVLILDLIEDNPAGCIISLKCFGEDCDYYLHNLKTLGKKYQNEIEYHITRIW